MSGSGYADLKQVKARINISDSITQADEKISNYLTEADTFINTQVGLHAVTPINSPDPELISLASGMAAALYNHWNKQGEFKIVDGYKKGIGEHIRVVYGKKNPDGLTANTFSISKGIRGNEIGSVN